MVVYTGELCLTLPVLPWHSMVAARCQEPLDVISFGASSIPPLQRICRCLPNDLGKACAHPFCVTFASRGRQAVHSPVDFRILDICSDCFALLHAAQIRAGTLVARFTSLRQTSSTVMLPQVAGLVVDPSRCTQHWPCPRYTCRHHPRTHNASCLRRLGSELST